MSRTLLACAIALSILLSACERTPSEPVAPATTAPAAEGAAPSAPASTENATGAAWGPQSTQQGVAVNAQKDGNSGLWIKMTGPVFGPETQVSFDGKPVEGLAVSSTGDVVTMTIPADYISTPGAKHVVLKVNASSADIAVGDFEVTPSN
jgi:hypothetical protein